MSKTVVLGALGTTLDRGSKPGRWERWRPTVDIFCHEDLLIDRLELLYPPEQLSLANQIRADIEQVSPQSEVCLVPNPLKDPWDFEEVYGALHDFAKSYPFKPEEERYLIHVTTGTHVVQICLFLLTESHHLPGELLQASPPLRAAICRAPTAPSTWICLAMTGWRSAFGGSSRRVSLF